MPCSRRTLLVALGLCVFAGTTPGLAAEPTILTVCGVDTGCTDFDEAALLGLGLERLVTRTPWTEGEPVFEGVYMRVLLDAVGVAGAAVEAIALNDYRVTIPFEDIERYPVLLARFQDGRPLSVRDKGPLWVIYPWSDHPELDNPQIRRRSAWQLHRLEVR